MRDNAPLFSGLTESSRSPVRSKVVHPLVLFSILGLALFVLCGAHFLALTDLPYASGLGTTILIGLMLVLGGLYCHERRRTAVLLEKHESMLRDTELRYQE